MTKVDIGFGPKRKRTAHHVVIHVPTSYTLSFSSCTCVHVLVYTNTHNVKVHIMST